MLFFYIFCTCLIDTRKEREEEKWNDFERKIVIEKREKRGQTEKANRSKTKKNKIKERKEERKIRGMTNKIVTEKKKEGKQRKREK